ncbi:MAG: hypothetical protein ACI9UA_002873, partial [Pseudoalteromonas tetraodonis]
MTIPILRRAFLFSLFSLFSTFSLAAAEKVVLRPAVEMTARDGLPNFLAKLEAEKEVR